MKQVPWDARAAAWLVRPFVDSDHITPNHFTTLRLAVGLAGAACFATGTMPNIAAFLIVGSNFLDHADGELARLGGKSSRFGHYYDLAADGLVTVALFVGIGLGLGRGAMGDIAVIMGVAAGVAIALIFHLRNVIETRQGRSAVEQPNFAGFEAEDVLYLLPLVTLGGFLEGFLRLASIGAPVACLIVIVQYVRMLRRPAAP